MCKKASCPSWIYPALVMLVIGSIYTIYMAINIIPQYRRYYEKPGQQHEDPHAVNASLGEIIGITVTFHVLLAMVFVCYFRAMCTSPGHIPQTSFWREGDFVILERDSKIVLDAISSLNAPISPEAIKVIRRIPVVERKQRSGKFRLCKQCDSFKPDRAHHCSICERCVLRMDHHCPWVNNCIGFGNYKYFILLLFYVDLTLLFVIATSIERFIHVFRPVIDWGYFFREDFVFIIGLVGSIFLFGALTAFLWYHMTLIRDAVTTIENKEKQHNDDPNIQRRWQVANIKYNLGSFYLNFRHVMGPPQWWLLPVGDNNFDADAGTYRFGPWQDLENHAANKEVKDSLHDL